MASWVTTYSVTLPPQVAHGSGNAYSNYRCRCDVCKKAQGERNREYRERNKERFREQRRREYAKHRERFGRVNKAHIARRKAFVNRYKLWCGCRFCGFRAHPAALEFHHRNPDQKLFNIGEGVSRSWESLRSEIRKCIVLCSNCHRIEEQRKWS